jgi:hypothetical protein
MGTQQGEKVSMKKQWYIAILILGLIVALASGILYCYLPQIMGPKLVFAPFNTHPFNVASISFTGTSATAPNYINMTIQNTGDSSWTLNNTAQVNSVTGLTAFVKSIDNRGALNCTDGKSIKISITMPTSAPWKDGQQYSITMYTVNGFKLSYVATAP